MTDENRSDTPAANAEGNPPRQPPVAPPAVLQGALPDDGKRKADDTKNEADELAREFRAAEKWVIGTNITLAIVGIIALCIYHGQLEVMRGQLGEVIKQFPEIQKSANAAKSAADTADSTLKDSQKSFVMNVRPYMVIDGDRNPIQFLKPFLADQQIQANITIRNIGKTPALYVNWYTHLLKFIPGQKLPASREKYKKFMTATFEEINRHDATSRKESMENNAEHDIAPDGTTFSTSQDDLRLSADEISSIQKDDSVTIFYVGTISYTDTFKGDYKTQFCYFHFGADNRIWHICDNHNTIR